MHVRPCFSGRNLGALFEVLYIGLNIINLNLLWCYFSMNSRIDQTERIALCYFSTNSWIDWMERIALRWFRTLQTIFSCVLSENVGWKRASTPMHRLSQCHLRNPRVECQNIHQVDHVNIPLPPQISTCKTYIKCSQILKDSIRSDNFKGKTQSITRE